VIDFDVFLDMMTQKIAERDPEKEMLMAMQLFDVEKTGGVSFDDFKRVATELGEKISDDELREMVGKTK